MATSAELTIKHAILSGYMEIQHGTDGPTEIQDKIFAKLYDPAIQWAVSDYLDELNFQILHLNSQIESTMNTESETVKEILSRDPMFKAFKKFYGMKQEGQNEYTVGCIQTANALMPTVLDLATREK